MQFLKESMIELITQTSTNLPPDVRKAMAWALRTENPHTQAGQALAIIGENIDMALQDEGAICQDTGMPTFEIKTPVGVNQIAIRKQTLEAVAEVTKRGKLRPNSVDSITGKNSGDNLGPGTPIFHFEQWERPDVEVRLILKGGGCENKNIQYSVPCQLEHLGRADRDLEGVKKCLLHAVWQAQGQGCAPGAIGVCIGSDRAGGYHLAKLQLFRTLDDTNPDPVLAKLEQEVMEQANKLGVGAMGFGGSNSLIGCKIAAANRLPASFFVTVAYDCWAFRRLGVLLDAASGAIATAALLPIGRNRSALHVTGVADRDRDLLVGDQVFQADLDRFVLDDGAARVAVFLFDFLELLDDDATQLLFAGQDRFVLGDAAADLGQFLKDFVDRQPGQTMQLQFQNSVGLRRIEGASQGRRHYAL